MKPIIALFLIGSAAVMVGGCGGNSQQITRVPSLYDGSWTGTWTGPESNDGGTFALKIDAYGNISGTMNRGAAIPGTIGGIVNGTGKFTLTSVFTTDGNFLMNGEMVATSPTSGPTLSGTFTYVWNGSTYTGTFTAAGAVGST